MPIGLGVIIVLTAACIIWQCKRNRVLSEQQQRAFEEELARCEREGIEIPDELKKKAKGRAAYSNKASGKNADSLGGATTTGGGGLPDEKT